MRAGRKWPDATASPPDVAAAFVAVLKRRLVASTRDHGERPWGADDQRRWRKQFDQQSPLSVQLSRTR